MHRKITVTRVQNFLRPTINVVHQTRIVFIQNGDTYSRDSINNIMFSLHLTVNTCCDMGIKSFLTIPDIEQKRLCGKLNSHFT